jgi:predicted O-methyltransferase YrrM
VQRAQALAHELGFEKSCTDEVGALLHVLAGQAGRRRAGEIGTGCGVAAAWIVSALDPAVPFVTVESEPRLAAAAAGLFEADENVHVVAGDWRGALADEGPFDLLFVDAHDAKDDAEAVLRLLAPRGTAVLDDFTVGRAGPDPRRDAWLRNPALAAVELLTTPAASAIVAVRQV